MPTMLKRALLLVLATAVLLAGCGPGTADRERMAAEMQAAAPDLIVGYHYRRGGLIDDAVLNLYLEGDPSDEQVRGLACDVLAPILRGHGDAGLPVDLWLDKGDGAFMGDVREICAN